MGHNALGDIDNPKGDFKLIEPVDLLSSTRNAVLKDLGLEENSE